MKIFSLVFLFLLLPPISFASACSSQSAQPKLVKVPGTKVSLAPPASFKLNEQLTGFIDEETGAAIIIVELPTPYSEDPKLLTKELAARGYSLLSKREVSLNGRPGILVHVRSEVDSVALLGWLVITGNEKETVLVAVNYPEQMKARLSSAMEQLALSVQWDAEAQIDPLASLNFSFEGYPLLEFVTRIPGGIMLTKDGGFSDKPTNDPFFAIASSFYPVKTIADIKKYAEHLLMTNKEFYDLVIKKQSDVTIAGLRGREIIAEAKRKVPMPDTPVIVYQVFLVDEQTHVFMVGSTPREEQEKYLEVFNRIAQSFRKK